jgi:muramoyltetrapeptide carboxypeptidase LdcA involved in peptidoglycan recycling
MFPAKLKKGDEVMVIAPALSLAIISQEARAQAGKRFEELGLSLEFSAHCEEIDEFASSALESRLKDFHAAFAEPSVKGIITVIGGFNCNQMLPYIDWELINKNPKIFCGYSDITALQNAILARTGLVTYSGPHYSTFGQELHFDYTFEYFQRCLLNDDAIAILPSDTWSDDQWWFDQRNRNFLNNPFWLMSILVTRFP